ncbi:MAG: cell wall-active antibiotics response protein [Candidatus Dependentiae bacterium]|nr:cell wall-active antibiotics response protein [Candidatus Dependentiae bacterium]
MCGSIVIGAFFLLAGITILLNIILGVHIPFGRIFWGALLIYIGVVLVTGTSRCRWCTSCGSRYQGTTASYSNWAGSARIIFDADAAMQSGAHSAFSTVMGETNLDLTGITADSVPSGRQPLMIDVSTVFGKTEIRISRETPVRIDLRGAFSGSTLPDHTNISFGSHSYISHPDAKEPVLRISASTVFGALEVISV